MGGRRGWYEDKIQREEKCMCLPPIKLWHQEPDSIREPPHPPSPNMGGRRGWYENKIQREEKSMSWCKETDEPSVNWVLIYNLFSNEN